MERAFKPTMLRKAINSILFLLVHRRAFFSKFKFKNNLTVCKIPTIASNIELSNFRYIVLARDRTLQPKDFNISKLILLILNVQVFESCVTFAHTRPQAKLNNDEITFKGKRRC